MKASNMKYSKHKLVGLKQIVRMLENKQKDNKSPFINFSMKDINNNLSSISLEILANELEPFVKK